MSNYTYQETYFTFGPFNADTPEFIEALDEAAERARRLEEARRRAKRQPGFFVTPEDCW